MRIEENPDSTGHKPSAASQKMAELIREAQRRQRGETREVRQDISREPASGQDLITRAWRAAGKNPEDRYLQIRK